MDLFDPSQVFDEDYLFFYEPQLTAERNDREAELVRVLLEATQNMRVLDLACGHGRIANRLAKFGCQVAGLDNSALFLERARRDAESMGVGKAAEYVLGDMGELPWANTFDGIVCWFTAFGYFDDEDNRRVLRAAHRALKPGGKLVIETINRDRLLKEFQAYQVVERDGQFQFDHTRFDPLSGRTEAKRTVLRAGQTRTKHFSLRIMTATELVEWLRTAGFSEVRAVDEKGQPFSLASWRMVAVATA